MTNDKFPFCRVPVPIAAIVILMLAADGIASRPPELSGRVVFSDAGVPGATVSAVRRPDPASGAGRPDRDDAHE